MDNEELEGVKFSEFPSATPDNADEVVGLHANNNARFSVANFILAIRQGLANIFVPKSDVGVANGVAELDSMGKVPSNQLPPIASTAADVTYDNTQSGLTADDVQEAIDELAAGAGGGGVDPETIAPVEESTTATVAHPLGSIFYLNDVLYRALADIAIGGTINTAAGGNATQTSIAQNFKRTVTLTSAEYTQLSVAEKAADIVYIITDDNSVSAEDVGYDPTTSGLAATNVQEAIDEVYDEIPSVPSASTANPQMDSTASPGSTGEWADGGHVHPRYTGAYAYDTIFSTVTDIHSDTTITLTKNYTDYKLLAITFNTRSADTSSYRMMLTLSPLSIDLWGSYAIANREANGFVRIVPVGDQPKQIRFALTDLTALYVIEIRGIY